MFQHLNRAAALFLVVAIPFIALAGLWTYSAVQTRNSYIEQREQRFRRLQASHQQLKAAVYQLYPDMTPEQQQAIDEWVEQQNFDSDFAKPKKR